MNIISSSQDIFFLVLAFCILWFTIFLTWLMYYVISAVRQIHQTIARVKNKLDAVDELISFIKDKVSNGASYLTFIVSGVGKLVELLSTKEKSSKKSKR